MLRRRWGMGVTAWRSLQHDTYSQVIAGSQRRAAGRVSEVLFPDVLKLDDSANNGKTIRW
jgi:hypothetical protein